MMNTLHNVLIVYRTGWLRSTSIPEILFSKNVPGVGWGGVGHDYGGVGWGGMGHDVIR